MIDCRSPHYRRKGERDGRIDWKRFIKETIPQLVSITICCGIIFWAGRQSVIASWQIPVAFTEIYKEYKSYRVQGH